MVGGEEEANTVEAVDGQALDAAELAMFDAIDTSGQALAPGVARRGQNFRNGGQTFRNG